MQELDLWQLRWRSPKKATPRIIGTRINEATKLHFISKLFLLTEIENKNAHWMMIKYKD